jgi:hypothetical protein
MQNLGPEVRLTEPARPEEYRVGTNYGKIAAAQERPAASKTSDQNAL